MIMRYKFIEYPPIPEESVIKRYQDFDQLLKKYQNIENNHALKGADAISVTITFVLISYALFYNSINNSVEKVVTKDLLQQEMNINPIPAVPVPPLTESLSSDEPPEQKEAIITNVQKEKPESAIKEQQPNKASTYMAASPLKGFEHLYQYFSDSLRYPDEAEGSDISGEVIVEFTITESGTITDVKITQSLKPEFDREAERLIRQMPGWQPAYLNEHPVKSRLSLPIFFDSNASKENEL